MGRALITNSLVLSKLWHLLRVVSMPKQWMKKIRSMIRKFVCPYNLHPSWATLCRPKRRGGAGLIDIEQQNLAMHHAHLINVSQKNSESTVPPLLNSLFRAYTGHASITTWFLAPKLLRPLLSAIPQLRILSDLLIALPSLRLTALWPSHQLLQLPLDFFYWAPLRPKPISKVPWSIYLNEIVTHRQDDGILLIKPFVKYQ
jgi:hypothetical protein